jgi:arylsulfatase A-like enzyme
VTPNIDRLAADSVRFDFAISTAGLTPMAHASILTGLNPDRHGLRFFSGNSGDRLPDDVPTLATILREKGSQTAAFVSAYPLDESYGFPRGFETYETGLLYQGTPSVTRGETQWLDALRSATQRRGDHAIDQAMFWLQKNRRDRPWFLWVHLFDVHDYSIVPPRKYAAAHEVEYGGRAVEGNDLPTRERMYRFEMRFMDEQLGRLLDWVSGSGQYENTLIAVLADHGQGLTDGLERHGWMKHRLLYQWAIRVPFLLRLPGLTQPSSVSDLVRVVDVFPTLIEALGLPAPEELDGRSLLPLLAGESEEPRLAYAESLNRHANNAPIKQLPPKCRDDMFCVMDRRWKLVWHKHEPENSELFDLEADPEELENVAAQHPDQVERLKRVLEQRGSFDVPFDPEVDGQSNRMKLLRELGYIDDPDAEEGDAVDGE